VAKQALRERVLADLRALPPATRALEEDLVHAAVQADPVWRKARTVLLYRAVPPEFSVVGLTLAAWRLGKRTLFPRVDADGRLTLHEAASWEAFRPGRFGIPEPVGAAVPPTEVDLSIVPGVAWDAKGRRLGRGGGYYDRLIPQLSGPVWGVAFDCQVVDEVPAEAWDAPVLKVWCMSGMTSG
jgi:5-formyltetrahydrofolate cyclo-ligase